MKAPECEFEDEVLAAAIQSRWPQLVSAELRGHVAVCTICADIATVAQALDESRQELRGMAVLPDSGRAWWQAQMRARREAVKAAGRPIAVAQLLALACALGLLGVCFGATSSWLQERLVAHGLLTAAMFALVLAVPVSVYLVVGRD